MRAATLQGVVTLVVIGAALAGYDYWVLRPALRVGVVDVGEVYRQKEAEFTLILTRAGSDDERQQAITMARAFSKRLPAALDELPRECACLVVLKSAVAGQTARTIDLTAHLKSKVEGP